MDLISDDDDEQDNKLECAIQASKHEAAQSLVAEQSSKSDNPVISTFLSERAQLEKARRERQKRLRTQSSEGEYGEQPSKRHHFSSSVTTRTDSLPGSRSSTAPSDSPRQSPVPPIPHPDEEEQFFDGELRQTATQHGEPRHDGRPTFRLTQILGKVWISLDLRGRGPDNIVIRDLNLLLPFCRLTH